MLRVALVSPFLLLALGFGSPLSAAAPTLGVFEFIGQWRAPDGTFVDFEDIRDLPDSTNPPADHGSEEERRTWEELPDAARKALDPFSDDWKKLPPRRRLWASHGAEHWAGLTPQQRTMWDARLDRWNTLGPDDRRNIRGRFLAWASLPAADRAREMQGKKVGYAAEEPEPDDGQAKKSSSERPAATAALRSAREEHREWFRSLPPEQRRAFRKRFEGMSREERHAFRRKLFGMSPEKRRPFLADDL